MSSRHLARLQKAGGPSGETLDKLSVAPGGNSNDDEEDDDEDNDEENREAHKTRLRMQAMRALQSSSSEEEGDSDEEGEEEEEEADGSHGAANYKDESGGQPVENDDDNDSSVEEDETPQPRRRVHQRDIRRQKRRLLQQQMEEKEKEENGELDQDDEKIAKDKADLELLDSILEEQGISPEVVAASVQQDFEGGKGDAGADKSLSQANKSLSELFCVDQKSLDVDAVLRKRFGSGMAAMFNNAMNNRGVNQHGHHGRLANIINNSLRQQQRYQITRKVIFGNPKQEWPQRPPSYVSGGVRLSIAPSPALPVAKFPPISSSKAANMSFCAVPDGDNDRGEVHVSSSSSRYSNLYQGPNNICFQFEWSAEYKELQTRYNQIINSGDANLLVVFLSQHSYHIDGLLQLALIFAKIGHMDRSSDLVRRSLFYLECACIEKFKVKKINMHTHIRTYIQNVPYCRIYGWWCTYTCLFYCYLVLMISH